MKKQKGFKTEVLIFVTIIVFLIAEGLFHQAIYTGKNKKIAATHEEAEKIALTCSKNIESSMKTYSDMNEIWALQIMEKKGSVLNFRSDSSILFPKNTAMKSFALAPEGKCKPEWTFGKNGLSSMNMFTQPSTSAEAAYSRYSGKTTLAGPLSLDGEKAFIFITPVYSSQAKSSFWGFAVSAFDNENFFDGISFEGITREGFDFHLQKWSRNEWKNITLASSTQEVFPSQVSFSFDIAGDTWTLNLYPKSGWVNKKILTAMVIVSTILSLLTGFLSSLLVLTVYHYVYEKHIAGKDPCTGLANENILMQKMKKAAEDKKYFALLLIKILNLKEAAMINGKDCSGELMEISAKRLLHSVREEDNLFYIQEGLFALLIEGNEEVEISKTFIVRLRSCLERSIFLKKDSVSFRLGFGSSSFPKDSVSTEEILQTAFTDLEGSE